MNDSKNGLNVCVIGGTGGIGQATVNSFLQKGASVISAGRNKIKAKSILSAVDNEYKDKISVLSGDLSVGKDRKKIIKNIKNIFNNIDVLVLAIGNGNVKKGIVDKKEWDLVFNQNFYSNILMTQDLLSVVRKGGSIIFVGSIACLESIPAPITYTVAKAALAAYSKKLSVELASREIRVNCVHPGNIFFSGGRWEELKNLDNKSVKDYIDNQVPMKRFGTPNEIASVISFLASKEASFITGASIVVDGGQLKKI